MERCKFYRLPQCRCNLLIIRHYSATGQPIVTVSWSGASSAYVDVYRNGIRLINTPNDGVWSDRPRTRGSYTYKVCNSGSSTCSTEAAITI